METVIKVTIYSLFGLLRIELLIYIFTIKAYYFILVHNKKYQNYFYPHECFIIGDPLAKSYKIGFTRPALLQETVLIAQLFQDLQDWGAVKLVVQQENLLLNRTARSGEIMFSEIHKRLGLLAESQLAVIADNFPQDVFQLVWIALCKQYSFIGDFTVEVLEPAHSSGRDTIGNDDYRYFFNMKAEWHAELDKVSDKTRSNAKQALFQMMRQCNLLSESNQLVPQLISDAVQNCSPNSDIAFIPGAIRI